MRNNSLKKAVDRLLSEDVFQIWVPGESCDSGAGFEVLSKADAAPDAPRLIGGFCSTESLDRQAESVCAKGLNFDEFVNYGWFNDNHRQETGAQVGNPHMAKLVKGRRWYTKGELYKGYEPSDRIWNLAQALRKSSSRRRLGFSIEGKVQERDRHKIVKAKVRNVAITAQPVNTDCTWDVLAKAMAPGEATAEYDRIHPVHTRVVRPTVLTREQAAARIRFQYPNADGSMVDRLVRVALHYQGV